LLPVGVNITREDVENIFKSDAPDGFEAVSFFKGPLTPQKSELRLLV
jgi:hypothetical protein